MKTKANMIPFSRRNCSSFNTCMSSRKQKLDR